MLKHVSNSPDFLASTALQRYFLDVLPVIDWSHESLRSCKALECLLGRLNRTLPKMLEFAIKSKILIETLKKAIVFDISGCASNFPRSRLDIQPNHTVGHHSRPSFGEVLFGITSQESSSISASVGVVKPAGKSKQHPPVNGEAGSHCSPRHSNQENVYETTFDDSDIYACQFAAEVIRLLSLFSQILGVSIF
ncbi:unnamed protein product [Trichobilharzia regenti]|nr:unnamed protein product [Trichobilharzia regenti]